eukprot:CAMPEP_0177574072 /NCGR_PEP_ID=MMETSP0369-20130122/78857_1 /TAXON_ID=447022 ORGANISM="Scrippsiella hangoei-like, Strain SHHI-4" /NCGR_SAMPLE_ID=MMETSP0369 /ASSEMBLY_ACC=CAM_ASM_000364 /LENGTH=300 /DNA_ID=CAMNT_0019062209 /DNA_START=35 /DNA_END=937 /DNA_ORIENTATION=+
MATPRRCRVQYSMKNGCGPWQDAWNFSVESPGVRTSYRREPSSLRRGHSNLLAVSCEALRQHREGVAGAQPKRQPDDELGRLDRVLQAAPPPHPPRGLRPGQGRAGGQDTNNRPPGPVSGVRPRARREDQGHAAARGPRAEAGGTVLALAHVGHLGLQDPPRCRRPRDAAVCAPAGAAATRAPEAQRLRGGLRDELQELHEQFMGLDLDGGGSISREEFQQLLMKTSKLADASELTPSRQDYYWKMIVQPGNQTAIQFEDFLKFCVQLRNNKPSGAVISRQDPQLDAMRNSFAARQRPAR